MNADPDFVRRFGKISESLVGSIMTNAIYKGRFRFNFLATDIQDDCRIIRKKDPDEVIYIEGFCEGIVAPEIVDKVHADVRKRSEKVLELRAAKEQADGKLIQPTSAGLVLVYPLTGLVRCAICGAAMRPSKSGAKSKDSASYYYYRCPCAGDGRCSNKLYLRGPWLWKVVIARLREVLFPLPGDADQSCPDWLPELIAEVRSDLIRQLDHDQDCGPMLQKEAKDIEGKASGWTETLSKRDLSPLVRSQVEQQLNVALQRKQEIEGELDMLASGKEHVEEVLDPKAAIDRLCRLDEVLTGANPSDINVELSRHIESILVHPDGTVTMRTNRLGVFEGVAEILAGDRADAGVLDDIDGESDPAKIRPRALSRRRTSGPGEDSKLAKSDGLIEKAVELPDKWVDESLFHMPKLTSWAEDHSEEVFHRRQQAKLSYAKLAAEFGVTPPTARAAVKHYLATNRDARDEVNLPRGGQRPPKFDLAKFGDEARQLWEGGWSKLKLAEKYGCSAPTIDKALAWAYEQEGLSMPTQKERKELQIARARAMLDEDHTLEAIAETLRVSDVTARKYLRASFAAEEEATMPDLRSNPRRPR
jgi:hypothetical protein